MNEREGAAKVFNWLVSLTTIAGLLAWATINLTFVFFYFGMRAQGFNRDNLAFRSRLQPYLAYWGIFWNIMIILISGFKVFWSFDGQTFVSSYINIPLFAVLYVGWKMWKKTKLWKPSEMDFVSGIPSKEDTEHEH